jgi:hypothetical protein
MAVTDEIAVVRDRTLSGLTAAIDFLDHNLVVWRSFADSVAAGHTLDFTNTTTGTRTNQNDLVRLSDPYTNDYLLPFTFQRILALFETFFFDLLRVLLRHEPRRLSKKTVEFGTILAAPNRDVLILSVVDRELNEVKYRKVAEWFEFLESTVRLGCPAVDEIEQLAEMKASRDILEHNAGEINEVYLAKAGARARYKVGERLEIPDPYLRTCWTLLRKIVEDVVTAATARLTP